MLWKDRKRPIFGLPLSFTRYSLDEERLYIEKGLFTITSDEVRLYRIMDVSMRQTLWQRIFNVGDVSINSSDKTLRDFTIQSIKNPKTVKELLSTNIETQREKKRVVNREMMSDFDHFEDYSDDDDNDFSNN